MFKVDQTNATQTNSLKINEQVDENNHKSLLSAYCLTINAIWVQS
jgi:hypothetical protein